MSSRVLTLRRADVCVVCYEQLDAGSLAEWDAETRSVSCVACKPAPPVSAPEPAVQVDRGVGGASAQREFDRRREARRERVMANYPRIGGLLLALVDDATSTKVWAQGAAGERAVADRLDTIDAGLVLHDRRLRRPDGRLSQANIDHIAIVPGGVWVIDAKTHKGKLEIRRTGGIFTPRVEQLRINRRDQTKLVGGVHRQVDAVRAALSTFDPEMRVRGAMCFVGTDLPWLDEDIDGIALRGRRGLVKLLGRPGELDPEAITETHRHLAGTFPPA
jgi:hypothetical protein